MVGIAAGTRSGNKQFGDILVADPSVDYNSGKVALADGIRAFLPDPYPIGLNPRLRSSPVAQKWMRRNGLQAEHLSSIFSLGGDEIDVVAKSVPGKSTKARMHNVFLLKGVAAYLAGGAAALYP